MKPLNLDLEDKENVRKRPPWNRLTSTAPAVRSKTVLSTKSTTSEKNGNPPYSALKGKTETTVFERKPQRISHSQSFIQKRTLTEKQLIAEKLNSNDALPKKLVLGVYQGKVIQSKVNSFRNTSVEAKKGPLQSKPHPITASKPEIKSQSASVAVKGVKPKDTLPSKSGHAPRPSSNLVFSKGTEKHGLHTTSHGIVAQKQSERNGLPKSIPPCSSRTNTVSGAKGVDIVSKRILGASAKTVPATSGVSLSQDPKVVVFNKRDKESAEERRARIAQWNASKGRVIKKTPVQAPEVAQTQEEVSKDPSVQPFWITLLEEDEQGLFTEKVNKTIAECIKLIDQGCPQEEILATLENLVQNVPDAKKLAKYWVCLARLEQQKGSIENVISICEKAVQEGAQPVKELQNILADLAENKLLKSDAGDCVKEGKTLNDEERVEKVRENEVQKDSEQTSKAKSERERRRKRGGQTRELKGASKRGEEEEDIEDHVSPEKENEESSVIKFSVHTTPYLQSVKKKLLFQDNDPTIGELKFLTPVRRSQRIERNRCRLPKMLQDHDPCVSSIEELSKLGTETDAFIYRRNSALKEMIVVGNET
nr:cytoskeleton-associated protein 2 isoform X2 [Geotrypetes seraphini]